MLSRTGKGSDDGLSPLNGFALHPKVYEPQIRARLGTAAHFCKVVVLKLRTAPKKTIPERRFRASSNPDSLNLRKLSVLLEKIAADEDFKDEEVNAMQVRIHSKPS